MEQAETRLVKRRRSDKRYRKKEKQSQLAVVSNSQAVALITRLVAAALLILAGFIWILSIQGVDPSAMTDIGLLSVLPPGYYAVLVVLVISFSLVVYVLPKATGLLALHITELILFIHATPTLIYGTLRYSWAWKHVGIIDYIIRHGGVDKNISFYNAYHNWPGFFSLNAFMAESAGISLPLEIATWAPIFFNLAFFGAVYLLIRSFTTNDQLVWVAVWFFFLSNWVGQDYFSPQAFAFFFFVTAIGILLRWFYQPTPFPGETLKRWIRSARVATALEQWYQRAAATRTPVAASPVQRVILMIIVVLLMMVINASHQLTPLILIAVLVLLAITRQMSATTLPLLAIVLTAAWMWFVAYPFMGSSLSSILSSFGAVAENVSDTLLNLENASPGQVFVAWMGRALTLAVLALGALGFFLRVRRQYFDLAPVILIFSAFLLLLGNSYGGEIVFRVFFFSTPALAFFIGTLFFRDNDRPLLPVRTVLMAGLSLVLLAAFLFPYYGKDKQYYFSKNEVAATEFLFSNAPAGSLVVEGARNYPVLYRNYEFFTFVPINREPRESRLYLVENPVEVLSRWMGDTRYTAAYLLITTSQKAEIEMLGNMPSGSLDRIEEQLHQSEEFIVLFENEDAVIFTLRSRVNEDIPFSP